MQGADTTISFDNLLVIAGTRVAMGDGKNLMAVGAICGWSRWSNLNRPSINIRRSPLVSNVPSPFVRAATVCAVNLIAGGERMEVTNFTGDRTRSHKIVILSL